MGCVHMFSVIIFASIIYHVIKAITKSGTEQSKSNGGSDYSGNAWNRSVNNSANNSSTAQPSPQPRVPRQIEGATVTLNTRQGKTYARIQVPLKVALPDGLVVQSRIRPDGPTDNIEKTFRSVFAASGQAPELMESWANPVIKHALVKAWTEVGGGFWLNGNYAYADIPVSDKNNPKVYLGATVLKQMADDMAHQVPGHLKSQPVPVYTAPTSPSPSPPASAPQPVAASAPAPAPVPTPPMTTPVAEYVQQTPSKAVYSSASMSHSSTQASGSFSDKNSSSSAGANGQEMSTGLPPDMHGFPVEQLLGSVQEKGVMGPGVESFVQTQWAGHTISGAGSIEYHQKIFGTDVDFGVSGGSKLIIKPDAKEASSFLTPKILMHLPDVEGDMLRSGTKVFFSGKVENYRSALRSLLLKDGRVKIV